MTGTDVREALRAVADRTDAPAPDRLAFQRLVRRERRRHAGGRVVLGVAVASVVAVAVAAVTALPGDRAVPPTVVPGIVGSADLEAPVYVVADGLLVAVDPQGTRHDLGPAEEVVGWTSEAVFYVDRRSRLVTREIRNSDEGPGGFRWSEPTEVASPVQSAQVSADGRWLGWVDLDERLHVRDLKAGTDAAPVQLEGSGYLVDLAQGTGIPLVVDRNGLALLTEDGRVELPTPGGWSGAEATATRSLVAVPDDTDTALYRLTGSRVESLAVARGNGRLSPYGDAIASADLEAGAAYVWARPGAGEPVRLDVPGDAANVAWGDDDTVLVSTFLDRSIEVYACDLATAGEPCARLDVGQPAAVRLGR